MSPTRQLGAEPPRGGICMGSWIGALTLVRIPHSLPRTFLLECRIREFLASALRSGWSHSLAIASRAPERGGKIPELAEQ